MAGSLIPVVDGEPRRGPVALFATGGTLSAAALGALLGALGAVVPNEGWRPAGSAGVAAGVVALAYSLHHLGLVRLPLPQSRQQVPIGWRTRYRLTTAGFLYGLALGVGFATHVTVATFYVCLLWTMLHGDPVVGAAVMAGCGLGRSLPIVWIAAHSRRNGADLPASVEDLYAMRGPITFLNGACLAASGTFLIVTSLMTISA